MLEVGRLPDQARRNLIAQVTGGCLIQQCTVKTSGAFDMKACSIVLCVTIECMTQVEGLPRNFEGVAGTQKWLTKLHSMRASDELSEDDARQLAHDLDSWYSAFFSFLEMTAHSAP